MKTLIAMHATDDRLEGVMAEMEALGSPTIRVIDMGEFYQAIDGTHRLAAAKALGIAVDLAVISPDEMVETASLDWQRTFDEAEILAGELGQMAYRMACSGRPATYRVDDEGYFA